MIILTGNSLGERQNALNKQVNSAEVNAFDQFKSQPTKNEADNIFLVDLAAKHRNIDYVLEVLKSGDSLYITRALNKCKWLCDEEFTKFINIDYLTKAIFPMMSIKMKKKLLCTIAFNLKSESRSIPFYKYCMEEILFNTAIKFLVNTPESFKIDVILNNMKDLEKVMSREAFASYMGNSINLARTLLYKYTRWTFLRGIRNKNVVLYLLRYMYLNSGEEYLDLLEKYYDVGKPNTCFGRRISKDIIKKHKYKIRGNPYLYLNILNKEIITKNSTESDAKFYASALIPDEVTAFWDINFYEKYKFLVDLIPEKERFTFIKEIFTKKYFNEKFEMNKNFYLLDYYNMMTNEEKEIWALKHITNKEERSGCGNYYMWYEFVSFDKAFEAIKKHVLITSNNDNRIKMICVLINSAKTQNEIKELLTYFYKRHVNETTYNKTKFLDELISKHNVLNFEEQCWKALNDIFHSLGVYSTKPVTSDYRVIALLYYIVHKKSVPNELNKSILDEIIEVSELKRRCQELKPEQEEIVFQYIQNLYIQTVESSTPDDKSIVRYISLYLDLLNCYSKTENDIAINMIRYITYYKDQISNNRFFNKISEDNFSEQNIISFLKKDAKLVINEFPAIKRYIEKFGRINWRLRKLKIYFEQDLAKSYLKLLTDSLLNVDVDYRMIQVAVYGIFVLADESFKIEFMKEYAPTNTKIDHANIPRRLLGIQQAICGYSCISRPHIPMTSLNQFLIGDYVQHCLPMFNHYSMNLPLPVCIELVETLIARPVSIQKHGLRMAFQCFSTEDLITLLNKFWNDTKNISMRKILYKYLYLKVSIASNSKAQLELFEVLIKLTLDLHEDDDDEIFNLFIHYAIPYYLKGQYLVCAWSTLNKFPDSTVNLKRKTIVIEDFENHGYLIPEEEINTITNDHVFKMLRDKEILNISNNSKNGLDELIQAKWKLIIRHLTNVYNDEQFKNRLVVVEYITNMCLEMRNEVRGGKLIVREFYMQFVRDFDRTSHDWRKVESFTYMKRIFATILNCMARVMREHEIFTLTLEIGLSDIARDVIMAQEIDEKPHIEVITASIDKYAQKFVEFLKDIIQKGKYFSIVREKIKTNVIVQLERVNSRASPDEASDTELNSEDLSVILCKSLLKYELTEIYFLILDLLPLNYCGIFTSEYEIVLNMVRLFKNDEVQYYMFEKFVNSDFQYRSGLLIDANAPI